MFKLDSRLLFIIAVLGSLTLILSCSQKDNVSASKLMTKVWLSAERLPTPPEGMIYGLWVSKKAYPAITSASQVRSLGRFSYFTSDTLVAFIDENGVVRVDSNEFKLESDFFDFSYVFVTVEVENTNNSLPGPVMLMETITGNTDTVRMYFPEHDSLFEAIIRCTFETPTDGNRWNDGYGLWFCNYSTERRIIHDTLSASVSYVWDTIYPLIGEAGDTLNFASLYAPYPDTVWYDFDTTLVDFGRDTLALSINEYIHYGAHMHVIYSVDSTVPRVFKEYGGHIVLDTVVRSVDLDIFSQDMYALPNLSSYGWVYKGWVVKDGLDSIPKAAVGAFTPPAWDFTTGELLIPGYQGGLLTTGTFSNISDSDSWNPFTLAIPWAVDSGTFIDTVLKRPRFPGEDFLDTAALRANTHDAITAPPYLLSPQGEQTGSVFVTIEPINMVTDTTNFPLIAFCRNLPDRWPARDPFVTYIWTLQSWVGTASGAHGFPKITARIKRL